MFLVFGLNGFLNFMPTPEDIPQDIMTVMGAMVQAGYMVVVSGAEVIIAVLLLSNRFVPLALALLAPIIVGIITFHVAMAPTTIGPGLVVLLMELYLAWVYRGAFRPMLRAKTTRGAFNGEEGKMAGSRKDIALSFLRAAASGNVREACRKHVAPGFRHHNAYFPADAESLMRGMEDNAAKNPNKVLEVQRAIEEGDQVVVHSRVRQKPDDRGVAVVHILWFDGDKIAELWDLGQPVPETSPNENGMF
jgi:predicted SnoaL-like aldol condensation-catalyzing enzyme